MRKEIVSDEQLVKAYMEGNEASLKVLVNRHKNKVYSTIFLLVKNKSLAEDLFQDTFIKVINTLKKGNYREENKFLNWVLKIARNLVIDHFRKTAKMPTITSTEGQDLLQNMNFQEADRETVLIGEQTAERLRHLINQLPQDQREVLVLRHYAGLSFKEIANLTGVSINTALGRMRYAINNLRKAVEINHIDL